MSSSQLNIRDHSIHGGLELPAAIMTQSTESRANSAGSTHEQIGGTQSNLNVESQSQPNDQTNSANSQELRDNFNTQDRDMIGQVFQNFFSRSEPNFVQQRFSNAPARTFRRLSRRELDTYNPNINYAAEDSSSVTDEDREESLYDCIRGVESRRQKDSLSKLRQNLEGKQGHPNWVSEISESLCPLLTSNLSHISNDLGVLGCLVYTRLFKFYQMAMSQDAREQQIGKD